MVRMIAASAALLMVGIGAPAFAREDGSQIQIRGEAIDTWCYFSGIMGGPEAVTGSAHHTCALWCSAGGIPVGLLGEDGEVYMVLTVEGDDQSNGSDSLLHIASHVITADGTFYQRDGINYIVVSEVVADEDIVNLSHEDFGVVPGFAIPNPD